MGSSEDHFTYAMQLVTSTSLTMVLLHAIKLNVLKTIAEAGPDARLSACEIASRLSILNQDAPGMLDRMLRLLASYSVVTCTKWDNESGGSIRVYGLAPVAKYFIPNEDGVCLGAFMELYQDDIFMQSWSKLKDSVLEGGIPFDKVYGIHAFEYPAVHYNIKPIPQRQFQAFPGDLSLEIRFPGDLSPGSVRWGTLARDSFLSDNPQRNGGSHIFSSQEISATVAHIPRRHVAGETPNLN
nr:caffeic acid 3-O-methyltransferase-like [Tanacetum cinerariifolium]